MSTNHLELLFECNDILEHIAKAQAILNVAREHPGATSSDQLDLDRKQADLDYKKQRILLLMRVIPATN